MRKQETAEKWTAIIEAARKHPDGIAAYCKKNGVSYSAYYQNFHRLKPEHKEWCEPVSRNGRRRRRRTKAAEAEFVSVKVVPDEPKTVGNLAVEIHLSRGPVVVLPHGMSAHQLADFVLAMEAKTC
jgi:hypothetical protein